MELKFEYGYFSDAVDTYSRVLGRTGRAAYKNLAEQKWAQVPALGPGDTGNYERHAITKIMEALARASGDIDELVGVKRHDLSSPHDFLEIAKLYEDADRADETLAWAERGLREFPGRADTALSELAADHYHRRGRHGEAIALAWARFQDVPGLRTYQALARHAGLGDEWDKWRGKALSHMRRKARDRESKVVPGWARSEGRAELVRVLLWEGDVDAAWREARVGGCSQELWLELAELRQDDHPEDALAVYRDQIEPMVALKNNSAYEHAVALLRNVGRLLDRLGRTGEFPDYVASVRAAHKPKRNFMKLLDAEDW